MVGSFLLALLILLGYMQSFHWIDTAIGKYASEYHGYTFTALFSIHLSCRYI